MAIAAAYVLSSRLNKDVLQVLREFEGNQITEARRRQALDLIKIQCELNFARREEIKQQRHLTNFKFEDERENDRYLWYESQALLGWHEGLQWWCANDPLDGFKQLGAHEILHRTHPAFGTVHEMPGTNRINLRSRIPNDLNVRQLL